MKHTSMIMTDNLDVIKKNMVLPNFIKVCLCTKRNSTLFSSGDQPVVRFLHLIYKCTK